MFLRSSVAPLPSSGPEPSLPGKNADSNNNNNSSHLSSPPLSSRHRGVVVPVQQQQQPAVASYNVRCVHDGGVYTAVFATSEVDKVGREIYNILLKVKRCFLFLL